MSQSPIRQKYLEITEICCACVECVSNGKAINNHSAIKGQRRRQDNGVPFEITVVCEESDNCFDL